MTKIGGKEEGPIENLVKVQRVANWTDFFEIQ